MKVIEFPGKPVIEPCTLEYYSYTFAAYVGCQHRCLYCYTQNHADLDWGTEVGIIPDFREQLTGFLEDLPPQVLYVGGDTDPYQPIEAERCYTMQALEEMANRGFSGSILTKSDLFTRDIDILKKMPEASVGISIAFNDETSREVFETDARPTAKRLEALRKARESGIATYALVCPVLPHITDTVGLVDEVSAFADRIWVYSIEVKSEADRNWRRVEGIMREHYPGLLGEFQSIVLSPGHAYWLDLRKQLEDMVRSRGLRLEIFV
jgi:DNA repair photolyase